MSGLCREHGASKVSIQKWKAKFARTFPYREMALRNQIRSAPSPTAHLSHNGRPETCKAGVSGGA